MKKYLLLWLLIASTASHAAPSKTKSAPPKTPTTTHVTTAPPATTTERSLTPIKTQETPDLLKNVSIFGFYNLADNSTFEGSTFGLDFSGTMTSNSSYGMGLETKLATLDNGLTINAGASYEFNRIFNKVQTRAKGVSQNTTFDSPKPELTAWVFTLNGELALRPNFTLFGGGNFNSPKIKNTTGTYSGKFGWQVGASLALAQNLHLDGVWRSFNISGSDDQVTFDNVNTSGFIVRGRMGF